MGGRNENDFIACLHALLTYVHLSASLSDFDITPQDIDWQTENCFKVSAGSIANSPVAFTREEIKNIYMQAL